jgi:hypothetical protein
MTEKKESCYSLRFWDQLMGRDPPKSESQPLQPVMIENGKLKLFAGALNSRFSPGAKVGIQLNGNHIVFQEVSYGNPLQEASFWNEGRVAEFKLPEAIREVLPEEEPVFAILLDTGERLELLPVRVQEHDPDVLGPRIIDEIQESEGGTSAIVRHIIRGFEYECWTIERLEELEELICSKPFFHDPLKGLTNGQDWVSWKVRNEILHQPASGDDALRAGFVNAIFAEQAENGSWENSVLRTAYNILHALSIEIPTDDARIQKAAQWLLNWPEPVGRPGMWMQSEKHLQEWNAIKKDESQTDRDSFMDGAVDDEDCDFVRADDQQQVIPTCARHFTGLCDSILHPSATAADALCRCGYAGHPRVRNYANSILQLGGMFGYFCACWGINDFDVEIEDMKGNTPDFNQRQEEHEIALKSIPYGYARDSVDLHVLARNPNYPGTHRPDLADTNGWVPYEWKDIGVSNHFAIVGTYWQNADCWAKTNRALSQFPTWPGTIAEFFSLFQLHLYQTPLGEWNQGFPAGILRWIAEATRTARRSNSFEDSSPLRFAKLIILKTIPWLRENQKEDGLWYHDELSRFSEGESRRPISRRLGTYHIVSVLNEFDLLDKLRP